MASREDKLLLDISPAGQMKPRSTQAARRLAAQRGTWRILPSVGNLLLLQRAGEEADDEAPSIALAGEITSPDSLTNILSFVHYSQWDGSLAIVDAPVRKLLFFRGGQLLAAASNLPEDRLGAMLVRFGKLAESDLADCVAEITPQRRLGAVLVEKELLTSHQLYEAVRQQSEEIFYSTLLFWTGAFYFVRHLDEDAIPARLHLDVQSLLLEGLRRIDEMSFFRSKLPSNDVVLTRARDAPTDLDPELRLLFDRIDGHATLGELSRMAHLGEFAVTKAAYGLLQAGLIEVRAPEQLRRHSAPHGALGKDADTLVIAAYADAMTKLHGVMALKNKSNELREALDSFVAGSERYGALFQDVAMSEDGTLPTDRLLTNARSIPEDTRLDSLQRGLSEMLFFALFVAGDSIDRDEERALQTKVAEALESIRKPV